MKEKEILGRMQQKHDIEANWLKAINFAPLDGELIIYDKDENCSYNRIKIGDGKTNVNDLPFTDFNTSAFVTENELENKINSYVDNAILNGAW